MVRLIASDIDGTLLPYGERAVDERLFEEIRRLRRAGILFCPASGRQYNSLRLLFAPVADALSYLCENGAISYGPGSPGPVLSKQPMDRADAEALAGDILSIPGCDVLISGENMSYVVPRGYDLAGLLRRENGNLVTELTRPSGVPEEIIKVSAFCAAGVGAIPPWLGVKWKQYTPAVAGANWLDFGLADKASGLRALCAALDVPLEDVVAFGDNYNDLPMLDIVGRPYLMETAAPELLPRVANHCGSVLDVLQSI